MTQRRLSRHSFSVAMLLLLCGTVAARAAPSLERIEYWLTNYTSRGFR
jgi:hypothetical protein